tara:strand:- start:83 stop:448 length:366 start_codon:yes stop_codon:yes gene_type:complete
MKEVIFNDTKCVVVIKSYYDTNRPRIVLIESETGLQVANCTVNIKCKVDSNCALIKDYRENKGIYKALLDSKIIKPFKRKIEVGFEEVFVCEIKLCRVCENSIHIPKVCNNCAKKIIENGC